MGVSLLLGADVQEAFYLAKERIEKDGGEEPSWLVCYTPVLRPDGENLEGQETTTVLRATPECYLTESGTLMGNEKNGFFPLRTCFESVVKQEKGAQEVIIGNVYDLGKPFESAKLAF